MSPDGGGFASLSGGFEAGAGIAAGGCGASGGADVFGSFAGSAGLAALAGMAWRGLAVGATIWPSGPMRSSEPDGLAAEDAGRLGARPGEAGFADPARGSGAIALK